MRTLSGGMVLLALTAGAVGCSQGAVGTKTSAGPSTAVATAAPSATTTVAPQPGQRPLPFGVAFGDANNGLFLVGACATGCTFSVWSTADGGTAFAPKGKVASFGPDQFGGADLDGLAVSGDDALSWGRGGAYASHDGGATWAPLRVADGVQDIIAVLARGPSWWVLQDPTGRGGADSAFALETTDGGRNFGVLGPIDPRVLGWDRPTRELGALLYADHLLETVDGGRSWQRRARPCPAGPWADGAGAVAESPDATLWVACGGEPSAGAQLKALYRSTDTGQTWTVVEDCHAPGPPCWPGGASGYLGSLVSPAPGVIAMSLLRGGIVESVDDGRTWPASAPGSDTGAEPATFVDAEHGWVIIDHSLWRTTNGGSAWAQVANFPY